MESIGPDEAPRQPRLYLGFPWSWWRAIAAIAILGIIILIITSMNRRAPGVIDSIPHAMTRATGGAIPPTGWGVTIAAYLLGLSLGHFFIQLCLERISRSSGIYNEEGYTPVPAAYVGFAEAILYPTAMLARAPAFIVAWIALKVAGQWELWQKGQVGRARFNRFLFGNGLAIMVAGLVFAAIRAFALDP